MSELMNMPNGSEFHRQLLVTVSSLALFTAVYGSTESKAADQDVDRPTIWIELGGQLERINHLQEAFSPPFIASITQANLLSALDVQKPPTYASGGDGKISFQPNDSNWVFSATVQYGRSNAMRHRHQQTANAPVPVNFTFAGHSLGTKYPNQNVKFADASATESESHSVLDFQTGKDVGLGLFGNRGSSVLSIGVRFAQFDSKATVNMRADPDIQYPTKPISSVPALLAWNNATIHFHNYAAMANDQRSFRGLGPSIAWNASAPIFGDPGRESIVLDWGTNISVLFGRQKASGHHQTTAKTYDNKVWGPDYAGPGLHPGHFGGGQSYTGGAVAHHSNAASFNRMRSIIVPNLGGFAGISFLYSNAKISVGYRADLFFGAIDGGIGVPKRATEGLYGPFASVSVGIGG